MQTTETNHLIRWILIIPGTLLAAALGLVCDLVLIEFSSQINLFRIFLIIFILPATTAIIWVSASYYIAPSHQLIIVWVSWVIGSLVAITWFSLFPLLWINAVTGGLVASLHYTYKIK